MKLTKIENRGYRKNIDFEYIGNKKHKEKKTWWKKHIGSV